jgi:hypothetical protein
MAELALESIVARARAISHDVDLAAEVWVRRVVEILPHQFARSGPGVSQGHHIGVSKTPLD